MKLWIRNALFVGFCLAATGFVVGRLLKRSEMVRPRSFEPTAYEASGFRNAVDRVNAAFDREWATNGIAPAPLASDLTIARRLSLALTGTIPSLEEIRALEQQPANERTQWWLSHLFEDRRYSDYLAERFARMVVGVENGPFIIYRRHRLVSWLSDQLFANRPYDEIVRELITADGIWTSKPEVNFITVTVDQNNKEKGPDEVKLAGRVAKAFLGVRLDCVQCHDDMFGDRWKQKDFHQLAAFFAQSKMSMTGVHDDPKKDYEYRYLRQTEAERVPPKVPFDEDLLPADGPLRERLAVWVTHPKNRAFAHAIVNRMWAQMFNRPLSKPVDNIPLEGELPPGMEILSDDLIAHHFDLQWLIRVIAATREFQADSRSADPGYPVSDRQETDFAAFPLTRLRPEQVAGSILQSASLKTINADSQVLVRIIRFFQENDFIKRYGDVGEDEFGVTGGTIPQRLIMMNGNLVHERTKENIVMNAATRIGVLAPTDESAVETAYLTVLSRRPTSKEMSYFVDRLKDGANLKRSQLMEDLFWTLINSTEFSWNH
ncbi:DUF1549 domain-containing protein [bacterium]|nr:DUF1549 domain-containing protein [bacterium]